MQNTEIAILGTGISSTILSIILAKHGIKVLLIDKGSHPRFAVGESTIPQTSSLFRLLAKRYDIPELTSFAGFKSIGPVIPSCGIKRNFGFVYHEEDKDTPISFNQSPVPHDEIHLFRQDVDAHLLHVAIRYGASVLQNTNVTSIEINENNVLIDTSKGKVNAEYVVDGTGHTSLIAANMGLREAPSRLQTHSRSIFTHMIDVPPYDECLDGSTPRLPIPLHQGTLHHIFKEGWIWVIPFDNHSGAKNNLCSVGLQLDPRIVPHDPNKTPEEEFNDFISRYPSIKKQFSKAKSVREWVSTSRLQYSTSRSAGYRFCLMSHAAGFLDPLFSRGICNTLEVINILAGELINAHSRRNFASIDFNRIDEFQQGIINFNDALVNSAYISFGHPLLWNCFWRTWGLMAIFGTFRVIRTLLKYEETGNKSVFDEMYSSKFPGAITSNSAVWEFFTESTSVMRQFDKNEISLENALAKQKALLDRFAHLSPAIFPFSDLERRWTSPSLMKNIMFVKWAAMGAPLQIREEYFDYNPLMLSKLNNVDVPKAKATV